MNLLPSEVPQHRRSAGGADGSRRGAFSLGVLFVGLSLALILVEVRSLTARLQEARSERDRLSMLAAERSADETQLRADRERLARLRAVEGRLDRWREERSLVAGLLRGLSGAVPDSVVVETLRREGADLRITGRGRSAGAVAEAAGAFSRMEQVGDLELLWVEQVGEVDAPPEQRFSLAGSVRYSSAEPAPFETIEVGEPDGGREP